MQDKIFADAVQAAMEELPDNWEIVIRVAKGKQKIYLLCSGETMLDLDPLVQDWDNCVVEMVDFANDTQKQMDEEKETKKKKPTVH